MGDADTTLNELPPEPHALWAWLTHPDSELQQSDHGADVLREQLRSCRSLFDAAPDGMGVLDKDGYFLACSRSLADLYGYPKAEIVGRHLTDFLTAPSVAACIERLSKLRELEPAEGEIQIIRKDGSLVDVWRKLVALSDSSGSLAGIVGFDRDVTDRKRVEEELRVKDRAIESAISAIAFAESGGNLTYVNRAFLELWGYAHDQEVLGRPTVEFWQAQEKAQEVIEALRAGDAWVGEMIAKKRDGSLFDVQVSASMVTDAAGTPTHMMGSFVDITERKRAEDALLATKEHLEHLLKTNPASIYRCEPRGDYPATWLSGNVKRQLGYESHEFTDDPHFWASHIHPEDAPHVFAGLSDILEKNDHLHEYRFLHKDGTYRWMRDELRLIRDAEGNPADIVGNWIDITERKQAEEALRKERDFSNSLFDASPTFFVAISAEGKTLMMNEAMLTALGYTKEEVIGADYLETFVPERDRELLAGIFDTLVHLKEPTFNENRVLTRDGRELLVEWRGTPLFKENGQFDFQFGAGIDITERRRAEEDKLRVEAQLRHAHKMQAVGQLAAGIAHDFNSILTVILGNAERILGKVRHDRSDSDHATGLRRIVESVDRGKALVHRLLTFGRAHLGKPQALDLNRIVPEMEKMLRPLIGDEIELKVISAPDIKPIHADAGQIEEAIMNLILNARDAMPDGGVLTVETAHVTFDKAYARTHSDARPGPHTMLIVSDTGIGMTGETRRRLFEPFYSTKPVDKGTGLGLSIVYGIVVQAGGHIAVTSEPDKGATFKLCFPTAE
jgi:PAS domain S-box-containing protein